MVPEYNLLYSGIFSLKEPILNSSPLKIEFKNKGRKISPLLCHLIPLVPELVQGNFSILKKTDNIFSFKIK